MRDTNQLSLWFCFAGGLFGYLTSAIVWWLLGALFWLPYWKQLNAWGMVVDDNGWAIGMAFIPALVGVALLFATLLSLLALRVSRWTQHAKLVLIGMNMIPGLLVVVAKIYFWHRSGVWRYPGAEIAFLLIGLSWAAVLFEIVMRRRKALHLA